MIKDQPTTRAGTPPIALDRAEHEPCQRGTEGCCVDHTPQTATDPSTGEKFTWSWPSCETW